RILNACKSWLIPAQSPMHAAFMTASAHSPRIGEERGSETIRSDGSDRVDGRGPQFEGAYARTRFRFLVVFSGRGGRTLPASSWKHRRDDGIVCHRVGSIWLQQPQNGQDFRRREGSTGLSPASSGRR